MGQAQDLLEKWDQRYGLSLTPQQQYRKYLSKQHTFSCIVFSQGINYQLDMDADDFNERMLRYLLDKTNVENWPFKSDLPIIIIFARINKLFLEDAEGKPRLDPQGKSIINKYDHLPYLNTLISKQVKDTEKFVKPSLFTGSYEIVQLTKRAKNLKELHELGLSENTRHATDFTWRLQKEKFNELKQTGMDYVNSYQKESPNKTISQHFEKYLLSLEGLVGYRGVRTQVGLLYSNLCKYFKAKMNKGFRESGGRQLRLSYVRASKMKIENNKDIFAYFRDLKNEANIRSRDDLTEWKHHQTGSRFLQLRYPEVYGKKSYADDSKYIELEATYQARLQTKLKLAKYAEESK